MKMNFWINNLLMVVFFGCSASYCGNNYSRIAKDIDLNISPSPISVVNNKVEFDFIVRFPPHKYNSKLDSICYTFSLKNSETKYLELGRSCHIMHDSVSWKKIIRQEGHIEAFFEMNKDTTDLFIKYELYKNGQYLRLDEFPIGLLIKSEEINLK